jgi:hypothetical protein
MGLRPGDALQLLKSYHERWDTLTHLAEYPIFCLQSMPYYEFVDGIFAAMIKPSSNNWDAIQDRDGPCTSFTFYTLPTADGIWSKKDFDHFGYGIQDFTIDPGQDLLVLLEDR